MNSRAAPPYQLAANRNGSATALSLMNLAETLANSVALSGKAFDDAMDAAARVMGSAVDCDPEAAAQAVRILRSLAARADNEAAADAHHLAAEVIQRALSTHQHPKNGETDGT